MLTISPTASVAIRQLVDNTDLPESAGIRIAAGQQTEQGTALELALVESPGAGDEVFADEGASVFVEPQVAAALDDVTLDAEVSDDEVSFLLRQNEELPLPGSNGHGPES